MNPSNISQYDKDDDSYSLDEKNKNQKKTQVHNSTSEIESDTIKLNSKDINLDGQYDINPYSKIINESSENNDYLVP